jgi:hypothetical protein
MLNALSRYSGKDMKVLDRLGNAATHWFEKTIGFGTEIRELDSWRNSARYRR